VGSFITVTGSGFAAAHDVGIEFGTTVVTTFGQASAYPTVSSLLDTVGVTVPLPISTMAACTVGAPCIETDANGWFQAIIAVPPVVGGAQTVTVTDGIAPATTTFTINPNVVITKNAAAANPMGSLWTSGFPDQSVTGLTIEVTGFAASDSVSVASTAFVGTPFGPITTGSATATPNAPASARAGLFFTTGSGVGFLATPLTIAEVAGGKLALTATGTSGLVATGSFTINPVVAVYSAQIGGTAFSMLQTGSLLLAGYGFPAGTIAANSITITTSNGASVGTTHNAQTIGSSGAFGAGAGNHVIVFPSSAPAVGPASIVVTDGTTVYTFNYANHNIVASKASDSAGNVIPWSITNGQTSTVNVYTVTGSLEFPATPTVGYGFPFIVSQPSVAAGQTGIGFLNSAAYQPNNNAFVTVMGANFATGGAAAAAPNVQFGAGTNTLTFGVETADTNGAFFLLGTGTAGASSCSGGTTVAQNNICFNDEPFPASGTNGFVVTIPLGGGLVVGSVLNPTLNLTPWVSLGATTLTSESNPAATTATYHGFTATNTCTLTVPGSSLAVAGCVIGANGNTGALLVTSSGLATIDLPGGAFTATGSDGVVTGTAGGFVLPSAVWGGTALTTAFSANAGAPGTTIILRSGTAFGVHGLTANTAYTVVMDPGAPTQATLGSFTSSSTGQIPAPGVQFAVPTSASGFHTVTIKSGTTDIFWNDVATSTAGGSSVSSTATATASGVNNAFAGAGAQTSSDASNNQVNSQGVLNSLRGQYGDLVLLVGASLIGTPSAVTVGTTTSALTLSGSGLAPAQAYEVSIQAGVGAPPAACNAGVGNTVASTFTSSASGAVPASTTVPLNDLPTFDNGVVFGETGTLYCADVSTPSGFQLGANVGFATFDVQASLTLNMTSAPNGHLVVATSHGLAANTFYNVIFNPQATITGFISGSIVGGILANGNGAGSGTFNVPNVAAGTYSVNLQTAAQAAKGVVSIAAQPSIGVTGTSGTCTNQGTSCFTGSGTPTEQQLGANKAIVATFTNNSNAPQTAIVYAVVHNALGQTVYYTTATVSPAAGASAQAQLVLFGLPSGSYTATIFVTSTGGTAISTSSTVSVTI